MVMVLLFLGVVFLLVGFQAMGSGDSDNDQSSSIATTTISATSSATSSATGTGSVAMRKTGSPTMRMGTTATR